MHQTVWRNGMNNIGSVENQATRRRKSAQDVAERFAIAATDVDDELRR
jgi:hypothetical protein